MYRRKKKDSKKAIQNLLDFYAQIGNSQKEQERKASLGDKVVRGNINGSLQQQCI